MCSAYYSLQPLSDRIRPRDPKLAIITANRTVADAIARLSDLSPSVPRCLAVVEGREFIGLFGDRQALEVVSSGRSLSAVLLADVVTPPVATIQYADLGDPDGVLRQLQQSNVQFLPVLNDGGQFAGLLTHGDICRVLHSLDSDISRASGPDQGPSTQPESNLDLLQSNELRLLLSSFSHIHDSLELVDVLSATTTEIRQFLGCDRVSVYQLTQDLHFHVVAEAIADGQQSFVNEDLHDPCFGPDWFESYRKGRVCVVADTHSAGLTPCHLELLERLRIRAKILIPVIIDNHLWGILSASESESPREWRPNEIEFLKSFAMQVATAVRHGQTKSMLDKQLELEQERNQLALNLRESEAQLRQVFDHSGDVFFLKELDGAMVYTSKAWESLYQVPLKETYDDPHAWLNYIHPDDQESCVTLSQRVRQGADDDTSNEFRIVRPDGSIRWVWNRNFSIRNEAGEIYRIAGFNVDITERKQLEAEFYRSQEELRLITNSVPTGIAYINADQRYQFVNSTYEQWFNRPRDEFIDKSVREVLGDRAYQNSKSLIERVLHGEKVSQERRIPLENGQFRYTLSDLVPDYDNVGNVQGYYALITDITECKQAEIDLAESEALKQQILDSSYDCIKILDLDGRMLYMNEGGSFGLEVDDPTRIMNADWVQFWRGGYEEQARAAIVAATAGGTGRFRGTCPTMKGTPKWWDVIVTPLHQASGDITKLVVISRDVTEQTLAEIALQRSEQTLSQLINSVPGAVYRYCRWPNAEDPERFIYISHGIEELYELTPEAIYDDMQRVWDLILPEDLDRMEGSIEQSASTLTLWEQEFRIVTPSGIVKWIYGRSIPTLEDDGAIVWCGILTDISDRKHITVVLEESEQKYAALTELSPVGVFKTDTSGDCVYVNTRYCEITGFSLQEILGNKWLQVIHPGDREAIAAHWFDSVERNVPFQGEYRFQRPDGQVVWFIAQSRVQRDTVGTVKGYIGSVVDISDRKQLELALKESQKQMQEVLNKAVVGIIRLRFYPDTSIQYDYISPHCEQNFGYTADELMQDPNLWRSRIHPEDFQRIILPTFQLILALRRTSNQVLEYRFRRKDDSICWILCRCYVEWQEAEQYWYITVVDIDISARKQAELALQESEQRFRNMADNASVMIWVTDPEGCCTFVSRTWCTFTGQTEADALGVGWLEAVHPDDRAPSEAIFLDASERQEPFQLEYRVRRHDGVYRWAIETASPRQTPEGQFEGYIGSVIDISTRKQAEQALQLFSQELELRVAERTAALAPAIKNSKS